MALNDKHDIDTRLLQIATVQSENIQFETVHFETVQLETEQIKTVNTETFQPAKPKLDHRSLEIPSLSSLQKPILTKPIFKKTYFCNYKCGAYFEKIGDLKAHLETHPVILIRIEPTPENQQNPRNRPLMQNTGTSNFDRSIPPSPNSELDIDINAIIDELDEQFEDLSPESQNSVSDKKRTYTKITPEIKKQVVKRFTEGNINQSEISRILEISGTSVRKILMKRGLIKPLRRLGGRSKSRRKKSQ